MVTGFDVIGSDKALQEHWIRRVAAYIIDIVIIAIAIWVLLWFLRVGGWIEYGLLSGLVFLFYCVIFEATANKTIGKAILSLEVTATSGYMDISKSFIRNIPKFFWYIFPLLDMILGLATEGNPRQTFMDRIAGTLVVYEYGESPIYSQGLVPATNPAPPPPQSTSTTDKCNYCGASLNELEGGRFQCSSCGIIQ